MKSPKPLSTIISLLATLGSLHAGTVIVSDNYNVTGTGSGFALNNGVNTGINPPTTRLTGTAAANLRYISTFTKTNTAFTITSSKLRVTSAPNPGRFVLSADGTNPFDFASSLGTGLASSSNPASYDLSIAMVNNSAGIQRFSFALGTVEGDATTWAFGFQVYRVNAADNNYVIGKRIDTAASGLGADLNSVILTMGANTFSTSITITMRVTDAGSESSGYHSRVQLSLDGGSTWFYDTASDSDLAGTGWRLNGAGRIIMWDQAPDAGNVNYDNFTLTWNSGPRIWSGAGTDNNWSTPANWGGATPVTGSTLIFNGSTRQNNTNDISGLSVPWVALNSGGFTLNGNTFTNTASVTNLSGVNTVKAGMAWAGTSAKTWHVASGTEVALANTTTVEVNGDHSLVAAGTLRVNGTVNIGQATSANPNVLLKEGKLIVDGGTVNTRGNVRIGAVTTGTGAQAYVTNNAQLNLTASTANVNVGDTNNPVTAWLGLSSGTLSLAGGNLALPYAAGATGIVSQTGGTISGGVLNYNQAGAGKGLYTNKNGTLTTLQIKKTTAGGVSEIHFDNAVLRTAAGASNAFFSGLDSAEIQSGGLTFDATTDVVVGQALAGAGTLVKTGASQLTLTAANSYSGGTVLNAGTLAAGNDSALGSGTITINGGTLSSSGGTRSLSGAITAGGDFSIGGSDLFTLSGGVNLGAAARTVTISSTTNVILSGAVSGTGGFTKAGTGTLTVSGASANTYSGTTTVNAGTLLLGKSAGVNAVPADLMVGDDSGGAGADVARLTAANLIPDTSAVTVAGSGLLDLNGNSETVLSISAANSAAQIALGGATLTVGGAGSSSFAGVISGSGGIVKQGAGTLTLSGANTYSGNTAINAGTLAIGSGGSIANSPLITLASGTTLDTSATSFSVGAAQTMALSANSGTNVVNGALTLASGAALSLQGNGSGVSVGALNVAGNLTLNGNTLSLNVSGSALGVGTYTLVTYTGSKTGSFNATPNITGAGIATGMAMQFVESAGQISLQVYDPPRIWSGGGADGNWSSAANWAGLAPTSGSRLVFNGTTRQTNTNNISGLAVPWITLNNGGFALYGNTVTNTGAITNLAGVNTFKGGLAWDTTVNKTWSIASVSEVTLDNANSVEVLGDHSIQGGGVLRLKGTLGIGQTTTANPAINVNEGKLIVEGGTITSRGGLRIGSQATGAGGQACLTNGATLSLTVSAGNLRVGDSANANTARLDINNSTLTMAGGVLCLPFAAGSTGLLNQVGGTVSGCTLSFSDSGAGSGVYSNNNGTIEALLIRKNTGGGVASMYFDNTTLRTASGASSTFFTGLNTAQIGTGGLTFEAVSDVTVGQALSGSGGLTKTGSAKLTLTGNDTYAGNTTVSAGTLAIGAGGSISNSPTITLANSTTLDISAAGYSIKSGQTLARNGNSGTATVSGNLTLASGAAVSLLLNQGLGSVGKIAVSGNLTLNANVMSVSVGGAALDVGDYTLMTYTGTKSGSFNAAPSITGSGLVAGLAAKLVEGSGNIILRVYYPAHGIAAATIAVVENDLANTTNSVTFSTVLSLNGFAMRDGSSRGDATVMVGADGSDDPANGVLMSCVADNGRDHGELSGTNFCTSSINQATDGYIIPIASAEDGSEYNIDLAAAYFPYNKWYGGYARNSGGTNGGANNLLVASSGINLGTQFKDNGGGVSTVNLTNLGINSQTDGVLLVSAGANNNNYALSKANTDGTWTIYAHDNGTDGAVYEQTPVAFVFIPKTNMSVISGRINGDGTIDAYSGASPRFTVSNPASGICQLTIPGYNPSSGVLVISAEGGNGGNADNILSYEAKGNSWYIQTRDLPGLGLQAITVPMVSFVFIPGPSATLISPASGTDISSAPTLTVNVTNPAPGNVTVTFNGHIAPKPGPGVDFCVAVLPDTQNYAREAAGSGDAVKEMWFAQTDWIVSHRVSDNVAYVCHLGDCVQNGDDKDGNPNLTEWRNATNAMYRLEDQAGTKLLEGIPYGVSVGNHDQTPNGDPDGTTDNYNNFFGVSHFSGKSYYIDHYGGNNDSFYDFFSAGGLDFMVISFEYGRYGSGVLDWANAAIAANPKRRVIVETHHAGSDSTPSNLSTQGDAIWTALKPNQNFFLMLGGHVFSGGGEGSRSDTFSGHTMRTLVSDYQGRFNGGNGLMRLMYFSPSNNLVSIKTYSPWTDTYETDSDSQFTFTYNMQPYGNGSSGTSYSGIKTNTGVTPGANSAAVWSTMAASKFYDWYVTVTGDNGDYGTSPQWRLNTTSTFSKTSIADLDHNGLPDAWENLYGVHNPNADDDGDGQSNLAEYLAGTNPTNAASVFHIFDIHTQDGQVTVAWTSVGGVRYRVESTDDLSQPFVDIERDEAAETDPNPPGQEGKQSYTDTASSNGGPRYYRVKVIR